MKAIRYNKDFFRVLLVLFSFTLTGCQTRGEAQTMSPITANSSSTPEPTLTPLPPPFFDRFVSSLINGNANQVVGVFVDGVLALRVVQQPASKPGYVSMKHDVATYFAMVYQYMKNTGLLADNSHAGIYFYDLQPGQSAVLIYGDGSTAEYVVSDIDQFQALDPHSVTSNFVNLSTGEALTATQLFSLVYGGSSRTTFQTCIAQGGESAWGRLFVIATQE